MPCFHSTSSKAGLERFTEALHAELEPHGIRVTMVRAGQMMDEDSKSPVAGELARRFAEENLKRGLDLRARPISSFSSVADVLRMLIHLPGGSVSAGNFQEPALRCLVSAGFDFAMPASN